MSESFEAKPGIKISVKPSIKEIWVGLRIGYNPHGFLGVSFGPRRKPSIVYSITLSIIPMFPIEFRFTKIDRSRS